MRLFGSFLVVIMEVTGGHTSNAVLVVCSALKGVRITANFDAINTLFFMPHVTRLLPNPSHGHGQYKPHYSIATKTSKKPQPSIKQTSDFCTCLTRTSPAAMSVGTTSTNRRAESIRLNTRDTWAKSTSCPSPSISGAECAFKTKRVCMVFCFCFVIFLFVRP